MIFTLNQIRTNFDMVWLAEKKNGTPVCTIVSPLEIGCFRAVLDYESGEKQTIYYNPQDECFGTSIFDRRAFKILGREEECLGIIRVKTQKVKGFLQSYQYIEVEIDGQTYYCYEVGLGNKGLFLCIYKGDKLIAIAEKDLVVVNYKDKYQVYMENDENIYVVIPLLIQYDMTEHGDIMEIALHSVKKKKVNTIQKELLNKYDPTFISKIKNIEEVPSEAQNGNQSIRGE